MTPHATAFVARPALAAIAAAVGLVLACPLPAQAQDKPVALKLSSWVPAQHALNPALAAWGADVTKQSGGTITTTLFPSEQLGKAFDHYDMAKDGIADVAYINPGYQPGRFPPENGATERINYSAALFLARLALRPSITAFGSWPAFLTASPHCTSPGAVALRHASSCSGVSL